jgi:4-hydroxy-3-methylbut-2-en-1-yl diphosphate reductase
VAWLSQTTLAVDETMTAVAELRRRYPQLADPPSDDICYASQNRQDAVKSIASQCGLVIVVGSANSSNSLRLVEVALSAGAGAAYLVDTAAGIDPAWLEGVDTVGLTSGASVPELLVSEVLAWLAQRGFSTVETVATAAETLRFSPPPQLRTRRAAAPLRPRF